MNTYGDRLDAALRLAKKDRASLSKAIDISIQAIGQVIAGKTKALTAENSALAAEFLKIDHHWLATGKGSPRPKEASSGTWPFGDYADYATLSPHQKDELSRIVQAFMAGAHATGHKKSA